MSNASRGSAFDPDVAGGRRYRKFWSLVDVRSLDECWPWTRTLTFGYGYFREGKRARFNWRAHRYAAALAFGFDAVEGMVVLHRCDNRSCCNPLHLSVGTQADNMDDMRAKEREARGEKHGSAKITEEDVRAIRAARSAGATGRSLAFRYGLHESTVSQIVNHLRWKHVS